MVHALSEIHRVLTPDGVLIDLRPIGANWQVEVASTSAIHQTGRVHDLPAQHEGDSASNQAMQEVEHRGWFQREQSDLFTYYYSWDTPSEMEEFINDDWADFIRLDEETKRATRSAWAIGEADCRVRIRMEIHIARWRKL